MRRLIVSISSGLLAVVLAACGSGSGSGSTTSSTAASGGGTSAAASCTYQGVQPYLYKHGVLTVATDKPAYYPWFWVNNPSNGLGYESGVAYAIAKQLGFKKSQVVWTYEPFNASYAPGPKHFDFDINEISYTPARATVVTFSTSYYDVQQALVALKGSKIASAHSPSDLKKYVYGDQIGTTSLAYIEQNIRPTQPVKPYQTLNDVKEALQTHQVDAFVTDLPTAQYISAYQVPHSEVVGAFPSTGEHYGLLFAKGDKLATCVDKAITAIQQKGTLAYLQRRYLKIYTSIPTIKP